jgi:hypothetical protein
VRCCADGEARSNGVAEAASVSGGAEHERRGARFSGTRTRKAAEKKRR